MASLTEINASLFHVGPIPFFAKLNFYLALNTAQIIKFSIKDFFSKCDQIRRKLRIWSQSLKKSLMENFIFCAVKCQSKNPFLIFRDEIPTNFCLNRPFTFYNVFAPFSFIHFKVSYLKYGTYSYFLQIKCQSYMYNFKVISTFSVFLPPGKDSVIALPCHSNLFHLSVSETVLNPFVTNAPFLYSVGERKDALGTNGLTGNGNGNQLNLSQ